MGQVAQLKQFERILIDSRRLEALFSRLGHRRAEAYVAGRVEEMTDLLAEIEVRYRSGLNDAIADQAQHVSKMAGDIGLTSLARAARDLGIAAQRDDAIALGAIWARLVRIGDRSLTQVWELPGLSI
ncbi:MAG: hypothetical protein JJT95_02775 [Pararhodobacter sp.]|nr:hypothetical protein [Pararhodobacter sp.]